MRIFSLAVLFGFATLLSHQAAAQPAAREISGQVRLAGQPAPAGIPVALQIVSGKYAAPSNETEIARTTTDGKGRFTFEHLETIGNDGRAFYAVSARAPGYASSYQIVDLTLVARGETTLDLPKQTNLSGSEGQSEPPTPRHKLNPQALAHVDQGQLLLFRRHDPQGAIDEFKLAVKADPWYAQSYILEGLAFMQLERWGDAQLAFSEATKVEPANAQAYLGLGSALNEQHDYSGAEKALAHSLDLKPGSAEAEYELARALCSQQKWEAAAPHARRAVELNADYAGPHALMGDIYLEAQDLTSARREFQEYLRLDPQGNLAPAAKQAVAEIDKALARGNNR